MIDPDEFEKYKFAPDMPSVHVARQVVTCKKCGMTGLWWKEIDGKYYKIGPGNILHICNGGTRG